MTVTVQDVMRQMRNYFIASTLTGTFTEIGRAHV